VDLVLFSNANVLLHQVVPVNFLGLAGEVAQVVVDVSGLNLSSGVFVSVNLLGIHLALDLPIFLSLGNLELFCLLDGLLSPILGLL
jgi:hypothetical protein